MNSFQFFATRKEAFALRVNPFKSILAGQTKLQFPQPSQRSACNAFKVSFFPLSKASFINIGLRLWQQITMHAPQRIHSLVLIVSNALAFGSFFSIFSSVGFSNPVLSSIGEVKFIITKARIEPPRKFM